jgi:hypothetical protein
MVKNKHGLDRRIPDPVKAEVRKRCGFGCVDCGSAIYEYHHFDPPFEEANIHDPNGITLLCAFKHDLATRGLLSKETISRYNSNPKCLTTGFSHVELDMGENFEVIFGGITFINTPNIIVGFGQPLLVIELPEEPKGPFRLSAIFQDRSGNEIARIVQNEWIGASDNWDISTDGSEFIIRHAPRSIDLKINIYYNKLNIKRLNMFYRGYRLTCKNDTAIFYHPDGTMLVTAYKGTKFIGNANGIVFG